MVEPNPYASPVAAGELDRNEVDVDVALTVRRKFLSHETNIRGLGIAFSAAAIPFAIHIASVLFTRSIQEASIPTWVLLSYFTLILTRVMAGIGLAYLQAWARVALLLDTSVMMLIGLVGLTTARDDKIVARPLFLGLLLTTLSFLLICLLARHSAKEVCSRRYRELVQDTSELTNRTVVVLKACILWFVLSVASLAAYLLVMVWP